MTILEQIAELDKVLSILKESWQDAKPADKSKWMTRIDNMLGERSKLMKIRDAAKI